MKVSSIEAHEQTPVDMEGAQGVKMRMLIGPADGAPNFHMRHFTVAPGGHTPHHSHSFEHEILVLAGAGVLKSDQGDRALQPNDVVFVSSNEQHQFVNAGDDPLEFICLIPAPEKCCG
jgi:quercetin dioxygenase-like cupin family protein